MHLQKSFFMQLLQTKFVPTKKEGGKTGTLDTEDHLFNNFNKFAYLLYNMINKKKKDSEIKLRINKKDKDKIIKNASDVNMNLSSYILQTLDNQDKLRMIPDAVDTWQLCNEIFYVVKESRDEQLKKTVMEILCRYVQKDYSSLMGGGCK